LSTAPRASGLMSLRTAPVPCDRCTAVIAGIIVTARHPRHRYFAAGVAARIVPLLTDLAWRMPNTAARRSTPPSYADLAALPVANPARAARPVPCLRAAGRPPSRRAVRRARSDRRLPTAGRLPTNCSAPTTGRRASRGPDRPPASPCTTASRLRLPPLFRGWGRIPTRSQRVRARSWRSPQVTSIRTCGAELRERWPLRRRTAPHAVPRLGSAVVAGLSVPDRRRAALGMSITAEQQRPAVAPDTPPHWDAAALHGAATRCAPAA